LAGLGPAIHEQLGNMAAVARGCPAQGRARTKGCDRTWTDHAL